MQRIISLSLSLLLISNMHGGKLASQGTNLVKTIFKQHALNSTAVQNSAQNCHNHYLAIRSVINHSDAQTLEYGMQHFSNCTGFAHLIKSIAHQIKCPNGFKGAWYELEAAAKIHQELALCNDEMYVEFNQTKHGQNCQESREIDIIFNLCQHCLWIECKNVRWRRKSKIKKQLLSQKRIIDEHNQMGANIQHMVCSKQEIPGIWKQWFASHGINSTMQ